MQSEKLNNLMSNSRKSRKDSMKRYSSKNNKKKPKLKKNEIIWEKKLIICSKLFLSKNKGLTILTMNAKNIKEYQKKSSIKSENSTISLIYQKLMLKPCD